MVSWGSIVHVAIASEDASPLFTLSNCSLGQEKQMLSGSTHRSSGVFDPNFFCSFDWCPFASAVDEVASLCMGG